MTALCVIFIILSCWSLGGMSRCCATLRCVSDALHFTKKITYNLSAFRVINVSAVAECSDVLMKSDISNPFSDVSQCDNVTMPKARKVKENWFKLYQQINSKINQSGDKNETTNVVQETSCPLPESDTSSEDSDITIVFDSKAEKMRKAEQTVINIDSDDDGGDNISVDHVDKCESDREHDTGTLHCSADSGPVADICCADAQNINSLELSANNIPAVPENIHPYEGTSDTVSDSSSHTDVAQGEVLRGERYWQVTHFGSTLPVNAVKSSPFHLIFNVMSYNVLSQDLLQSHRYLYFKHRASALKWQHRSKILYNEIQDANAEIVCLQEVQENQLDTFYRQLDYLGYASIYKQRTGNKVDGIAIYYKRDVFDLVDHTSVEYYQPGVSVLDRHNVGLVAKLAVRANPSRYLVVATTHLLYNPKRHDVKLAQIQILLAEVERLAFKGFSSGIPTYWPVIITGDMNFEPYTGVYRLLTEGLFRYEGLTNKLTTDFHGRLLSKELLPRSLDIADTCQHWGILCMRAVQQLDSKTQLQFLKIHNTDHQKILQLNMISQTPASFEDLVQNARMMEHVNNFVPFFGPSTFPPMPDAGYATGQLTHNLNLCSVYQHGEKDNYPKSEVTTHQGSWVTVDYIFYSCINNERDGQRTEGDLKLVAKYRLLTASEADLSGPIPNSDSPSDHYPLLATFFYTF